MKPAEILRLADSGGLRLRVDGGDLLLEANREPDSELLEAIRDHKAEIVVLRDGDEEFPLFGCKGRGRSVIVHRSRGFHGRTVAHGSTGRQGAWLASTRRRA